MKQTIKLNPQQEFPIMAVKLVDQKYANAFVKQGMIHLSNPKIWRDKNLCNGLQLDEDDGCFCYSEGLNDSLFDTQGRRYKRIKTDGGWKYFEDTDMIVGSCFYGILKSSFVDHYMQYGVRKIATKDYSVSAEYFNGFNNTEAEGKKTIIIFDMYRFYNLILDALVNLGAQRNEIFLSMVYYVNKSIPFGTTEKFPFEYFLKDSSFSSQQEFRLIVASKNMDFYKCLQNIDNNISIGDISSFSVIQDKYDDELDFSIQKDKLIYKLSKPLSISMDEQSFAELVTELYQIKQNLLPGEPKSQKELDDLAKPIIEHLKNKYGVEYRDDWRLYNVSDDLYDTLPDIYKGMSFTPSKLEFLNNLISGTQGEVHTVGADPINYGFHKR